MKGKKRPGVFLDRDGTINEDVGYISDPDDFQLIPGSAEAIARLNGEGFVVIVVTNQSGVARGYFTEDDVLTINNKMVGELEKVGAYVDGVYYCPHHPDFGDEGYRLDCECRKPGTGMVKKAAREFNIDVKRSFVVGDHRGDLELGRNAGAKTIMVLTGHGREERKKMEGDGIAPDHIADDLSSAVGYILEEDKKEAL